MVRRGLVGKWWTVLVLDRKSQVGGRGSTDRIDGFNIERGFQVLFSAFPVIIEYLDQEALPLRPTQPAARIALRGGTSVVADALRDPSVRWSTLRSPRIGVGHVDRFLQSRHLAYRLSGEACVAPEFSNLRTAAFLSARGVSSGVIDGFFAPFYGGIRLDRRLESGAGVLRFTFRMLAHGMGRDRGACPGNGCHRAAARVAWSAQHNPASGVVR